MNPDELPPDKEEEGQSPFRWARSIFLPVKSSDTIPVKVFKESAFYLFATMVAIVTILIAAAIVFVL